MLMLPAANSVIFYSNLLLYFRLLNIFEMARPFGFHFCLHHIFKRLVRNQLLLHFYNTKNKAYSK